MVILLLALMPAGLAGLVPVGLVLLWRMPPPATAGGQAVRLFGLAACGTATALGAVGGAVGFVLGLDYPPTVWFAVLEGACLGGVPGLVLGAAAGAVLAAVRLARA